MIPAAMPMANAPIGPTKPDAGVMTTRPATAPEQMPSSVGLPRIIHSTHIPVKPALRGAYVAPPHANAGLHAGADRRAGVETKPADPQQRGADHGQHHVVGR